MFLWTTALPSKSIPFKIDLSSLFDHWIYWESWLSIYPIYTSHFLFLSRIKSVHGTVDSLDALYTQHSGTGCVYGGESQCVGVRVKSLYHTQRDQRGKSALYFMLESNPSISAKGVWSPICLVLPQEREPCNATSAWNSIWSAWPPSLDHGWCLSFSPSLYLCLSRRWA